MAVQSLEDLELSLKRALGYYATSWQPVDSELYKLCGRRPSQHAFADVYTKTAVIGRVYEAGVQRAFRGSGDPESVVARNLVDQADLIDQGLDQLKGQSLNRSTAAQIIELHGRITKGLSAATGNIWLTSFVSKYLHFHCPIVPIYDSTAAGAIGRYVDWRAVDEVRGSLTGLPVWARPYRNYVAAFIVLYERVCKETSLEPSVRDIDYLLWQPTPARSASGG
jgi:hypothetical protein